MSLGVINQALACNQSSLIDSSRPRSSGPISFVKIAKLALASLGLSSGSSTESTLSPSMETSMVFCSREKIRPEPEADLSFQRFSGAMVVKPLSKGPIFRFPRDLCRIATQPEVYLTPGGDAGCYIDSHANSSGIWGDFPESKKCKERVHQIKMDVEGRFARPMKNSCPHGSRFHAEDGHPITDVSLYMSKARMAACISTYLNIQEFLEGKGKTGIKHLSTTQILDLIVEIHRTSYHGDLEGGKFRDVDTHIEFGPFAQQLRKQGGSEEDFKILESIYELVDRSNGSIDQMIVNFSQKQWDILNRVAVIPPSPGELKKQLRVFARKLSERLGEVHSHKLDAITVGAWAHQQILRMHPFMDGNGRVARVVLNTILQMGGYEAVGFPSEKDFYQSMKSPKEFRDYLAKVVVWNQGQRAALKA